MEKDSKRSRVGFKARILKTSFTSVSPLARSQFPLFVTCLISRRETIHVNILWTILWKELAKFSLETLLVVDILLWLPVCWMRPITLSSILGILKLKKLPFFKYVRQLNSQLTQQAGRLRAS